MACSCGYEPEEGSEGCGNVIEEWVNRDDEGNIVDTGWTHCGKDGRLCDDCKEAKSDAVEPEMRRQKAKRMEESNNKRITDEQGIIYEEVSYHKYLTSKNKHRIVKSLESQYFVEIDALEKGDDNE